MNVMKNVAENCITKRDIIRKRGVRVRVRVSSVELCCRVRVMGGGELFPKLTHPKSLSMGHPCRARGSHLNRVARSQLIVKRTMAQHKHMRPMVRRSGRKSERALDWPARGLKYSVK